LFIHRAPRPPKPAAAKQGGLKSFGIFILYLSPILAAIFANLLFSAPMWAAMLLSLLIAWLLSSKKDFLKIAFKAVDYNIALMLVAAYFIRNTVETFTGATAILTRLFLASEGIGALAVTAAAALILGMIAGTALVPLGLLLPLVTSLPMPEASHLIYIFFVIAWSFIGYYFTPLHMCQMLTLENMGVTTREIYAEQWPLALAYAFRPSRCIIFIRPACLRAKKSIRSDAFF
jgi:hypothetical protein